MLKTIKLYGVLSEKFGHEFKLAVDSPKEACRALSVLVPGFEKFMMNANDLGLGFAVLLGNKSIGRGKKRSAIFDAASGRIITGRNIGSDAVDMNTEETIIKIVPRVIGAGGNNGVIQAIIGVVLVVVGVFYDWSGTTSMYGAAMIGAGVGMVAGGVAQMLMPKMNAEDQNQDGNKANFGFGGAVTTVAQGSPVPVLIGEREIGGFILSANQFPEDKL